MSTKRPHESATKSQKIQVTVDRSLADKTEAIFSQLGLSPSTAITMFLKQVAVTGSIPFNVTLTERQKAALNLQAALKQADRPINDLSTPEGYRRWEADENDDY
ncbi:type II toxin-antitoxin system RelB/DinJ family antitoxin [Levilactobacillus acidifarinae]|uniref:DNA-damage-inducible protein J n=1 Tax=Levilactobacillus acidifarinae DSM 19394 = JCM 15949 TaxID=1423715 RepID=A0A0R1LF97_9LACO|nr:type II toxin-antitoxin system RelB/DinJ family antitoxin [Levilactobacillus acidifarinae]KRK94507.1 hypothetical protein FD25_GL000473 [Levilactobacillus acidifarinae DSM 19394]GEO68255.1 hypothetical protein LAC03_01650 [Levilactobacillus acidifarinae]